MRKILLFTLMGVAVINFCFSQKNSKFPVLKGDYLGQKVPSDTPEIFAPGIISNGLANRDVTISPDGKQMFFGVHTTDFSFASILVSKQIKGQWTKPEVVEFATDPRYFYLEPALSFDGQKMFFLSNMPKDSTDNPADEDIWAVDRVGEGWGKPYNLGAPINTEGREFYPSTTKDGTLYFTRAEKGQRVHFIYRSRLVDGKYSTPEKLPEQVNCGANRFNAYVAMDESYMVVPAAGIEGGQGGIDYYIVFRNDDDTWQEPINMGDKINSPTGGEWSFYVSPDNKYIFYMATKTVSPQKLPKVLNADFFMNMQISPENGNADIYWVDAKVIENLRVSRK